MNDTATEQLKRAHQEVFDIAKRASIALAGYEGTGAVLSVRDIAKSIGIGDSDVEHEVDLLLVYLAVESALTYRGWTEAPSDGGSKKYVKVPEHRHYRKPSVSPVALARARAQV